MASIRIKSKATTGGVPSGLTRGELAVNLAEKTLYVGGTVGNSIYLSGVQTFNGLTGAVTGVTVGGANVFTQLNTFQAGISASGATLGTLVVNGGISAGSSKTTVGQLFVTGNGVPSGESAIVCTDSAIIDNLSAAHPTLSGSILVDSGSQLTIESNVQTNVLGSIFIKNGISAAGGITFNSLSHFTQGLSGSGATLGRLVVNSGISASGGVTFHNNVWVGGLLTANGGISAAGGVTFNNTLYVGGTLSVQNNISYGGDLIRNGQAVSIISTYGTTSDLPRPGVQGEVAIVSGPIADYGMYLWDGGVSFEFGGVTGAWIRITNQNRYAWNPDADLSGVVDGADLPFLLAAWGEYSRYVAGGGGGDSTTLLMGIGDNLANAFEVKVYGATAGKKTSAFRITSDDAVPQISINAGMVQMNSDLTISPVGDYTTTISQVSGVIQTGFIHATGFTAGGKGSTFDGNLAVGGLLTLNSGLSAGGATFTAPVYMGATLTMNSNIRFNSGYGITGGFIDAGWY